MKTINDQSIKEAAEIAQEAAREAGAFLKSKLGQAKVQHRKEKHDELLDVDLEAERIILTRLRAAFPTYAILSEEAGKDTNDASQMWIVDPLDGSANFQHGSPLFGVAIALVSEGVTIAGIIYTPMQDEMFVAIKGESVTCNGTPIHVSSVKSVGDAIVNMGDFAKNGDVKANASRLKEITRLANHVSRVRMIGTAATDLAYVACGRADAYIMHNNNPWDIEAGSLIVREAGGKYWARKDRTDKPLHIWSNGTIHEELLDLITPSRLLMNHHKA